MRAESGFVDLGLVFKDLIYLAIAAQVSAFLLEDRQFHIKSTVLLIAMCLRIWQFVQVCTVNGTASSYHFYVACIVF